MVRSADRPRRTGLLTAVIAAAAAAIAAAQSPVYRAGVERIRLDVTVVSQDGTPVRDLKPGDFAITIDGRPRPVTSAEFVDYSDASTASTRESAPHGISANPPGSVGRITILAVDTATLFEGQELVLLETMGRYLDSMGPADRTGLLVLPNPGAKGRHVELTTNVEEVRQVLSRVHADPGAYGGGSARSGTFDASSASATFKPIEPTSTAKALGVIFGIVRNELSNLADVLAKVDGPKTLVLMSGGLVGGLDALPTIRDFAEKAARARLTVYVVHPNATPPVTLGPDDGLFELAGMTGGTVLDVVARGTDAFGRIARETSGSYVLGIDPPPAAPFTRALEVTVKANRDGLTVRSPKQVVPPAQPSASVSRKDALTFALLQPRPLTELPLRLSSFIARGAEPRPLKAVIVAEMPDASGEVSWGFQARRDNKVAADAFEKTAESDNAAASRIVTTSATLPGGDYVLTFAAVDASGRRGSVGHPLAMSLHRAGAVEFSDVFVGAAVDGHFRARLSFGQGERQVLAFVEVYGDQHSLGDVTATFSLVDADGRPLASAGNATPIDEPAKRVVRAVIPLPPGVSGTARVVATVHAGNASATTEHAIVIPDAAGH